MQRYAPKALSKGYILGVYAGKTEEEK